MTTSKAIVIASLVLGSCVLLSTGYIFFHDRSVAEAQRLEKERIAKAEADLIANAKAKAAWDQSLTYLETMIEFNINPATKDLQEFKKVLAEKTYRCVDTLSVKSYSNSDVVWIDPKTVSVKGIAVVTTIDGHHTPPDARKYYSWKFTYEWSDDNKWREKPSTYKEKGNLKQIPDSGLMSTDAVTLDPNGKASCGIFH